MRFSVLHLVVALSFAPMGAQAQTTQSRLEHWHPEAFVDPTKPASPRAPKQLELSSAGIDIWPAQGTLDQYAPEEMERRVRRARIGAALSPLLMAPGAGLVTFGQVGDGCLFDRAPGCNAATGVGAVLIAGGLAGVIVSGVLLRKRKRELAASRRADHGQGRWAHWDAARSRLVF